MTLPSTVALPRVQPQGELYYARGVVLAVVVSGYS